VLTANEADRILAHPDIATPFGLRDRAMLEVLYSTGMRRSEFAHLTIYSVDPERGLVVIRQGKGKKDRVVPIGDRAIAWLQKYLDEARPQLVAEPDDGLMFLAYTGQPFSPDLLTRWVAGYVDAANIGKRGSCHLFRHSMATLMVAVTSRYDHGFLTGVDRYTWTGQAITYWPNGMVKEVKHVNAGQLLNGPVDTYEIDTATGMARPSSIKFSGFCNDFTGGELASVSVAANSSASLTATTSGAATTFQWFEVLSSGVESLLSGQTASTLTATIATTPRRFFVRAGNGTCTIDSNVATVTPNACPAPDTTVTMLSTLTRGGSAHASVPHQDATYEWTITGGSITSGRFTHTVHFVVDCDAVTVLASVSVTPACGSTAPPGSKSASTTARTTVTLSASSGAIPQGSSKDITVKLSPERRHGPSPGRTTGLRRLRAT